MGVKNLIDITGKVFGRLKVIRYEGGDRGSEKWVCRCECGNSVWVKSYRLRKGITKSCGCLKKRDNEIKKISE